MNNKRQAAKNLIIRELRELLTTYDSINLYEDVPEVILCALVNHGFISLNDYQRSTEEQNRKLVVSREWVETRFRELERDIDTLRYSFPPIFKRCDTLENKINGDIADSFRSIHRRIDELEKKLEKGKDLCHTHSYEEDHSK